MCNYCFKLKKFVVVLDEVVVVSPLPSFFGGQIKVLL